MTMRLSNRPEGILVLCAVGDIQLDLPDPDAAFASTAALFQLADIACGDLEGSYTHRPSKPPSAGISHVADPKNILGLSKAGFAVVSCATNHILDGGYAGLEDTLGLLHNQGIATVGAGRNLGEARRPALITRKGYTVAFLGYASVFPVGYEARVDAPGLVPIRVHTAYVPRNPNFWQPGSPADALTIPYPADLDAFRRDIVQAKAQADLVVVSGHWGDSSRPVWIHRYERQISHLAIDAGADVVFGHHHHCVRGVEIYRGKPIFYGLGAFAIYWRNFGDRAQDSAVQFFRERMGEYGFGLRPGYPTFPFHPEYRTNMIARVEFSRGEVANVGLIPSEIQPDGHPEPFAGTSGRGGEIVEYFRRISAEEGLATRYELEGGGALAGVEAAAVRGPGSEAFGKPLAGDLARA